MRAACSFRRVCRPMAATLLAVTLAACGYKGPLTLPPPPADDPSLAQPPSTLPAGAATDDTSPTTPGSVTR